MKFSTPLRYPGGKGKLTDYFKTMFVENDLIGGDYAEPYAGGAGIGINLLLGEYASKLYLNDLNRSVYAFWRTLLDQTDELCALVSDTEVSIQEWHRQKKIQSDESASPLELGFSTFFLNRTNRSGIIIAGVIGGKDQTGPWKLDARFNKIDLLARIEVIARNKDRISLSNLDAIEFLKCEVPTMSKKSLVYLDPPYYVKG